MIAKIVIKEADELYDDPIVIPVALPELGEIRQFAYELHKRGKPYHGEYGGWPVDYQPMSLTPMLDSNCPTTPASFFIGVWPLWSISIDWEHGDDQEPNVLVWDRNIIKPNQPQNKLEFA